jgi:hypothetical protein
LLITKFRNKYNVVAGKDSEMDLLIVEEVRKLLKNGNASEAGLVKLDMKLGQIAAVAKQGKPAPSNKESAPAKSESNRDDVMSVHSKMSVASKAPSVAGAPSIYGGSVYHVDHTGKMNPSEGEWNKIVQQNLQNFKEEKERVVKEKAARARAIQNEQKRQIELKREKQVKQQRDDQEIYL